MRMLAVLLLACAPLRAADSGVKGPVSGVTLTQAGAAVTPVPQLGPGTAASLSGVLPQVPAVPSAAVSLPQAQAPLPAAASSGVSASASPRGPPSWPWSATAAVAGRVHKPKAGSLEAVREKILAEVGRNWTLPVEELLGGHDALLLGESHGSLSSYALVTEEMGRLKKAGVTAVGLEGLKTPHQDAVDRWLASPGGALPSEAASYSPSRRGAVHALFQAAKEHGIRLVALGDPLDYWARRVVELLGAAGHDTYRTVPAGLGEQLAMAERTYQPGYNEGISELILRQRNALMAQRLAAALKDGGKGVAIVGDAHVEHHDAFSYRLFWLPLELYGSVSSELGALDKRAFSATLTGGLFTNPEEGLGHSRRIHDRTYSLLGEVNPTGLPAFYQTSGTTGLLHLGGR